MRSSLKKLKEEKKIVEDTLKTYRQGDYSKQIEELYDDVMTFFIFCYHIKDYILNDCSLHIKRKTIEAFINSNEYLRICADICNGTKHLKLTHKRTDDGEFIISIKANRDKDTNEISIELDIKSASSQNR